MGPVVMTVAGSGLREHSAPRPHHRKAHEWVQRFGHEGAASRKVVAAVDGDVGAGEVLTAVGLQEREDRGSVVLMQELMDYAGAVVMTQQGRALYRCRRPGTSTLAARESKLT